MANLDYQYIGSLVEYVQQGDSNAFAELYAATYQKQFYFAYNYLRDEYLAQDALQETYISALNNISSLKDPKLFISWLNQINFRTCFKLNEKQKKYNMELMEYDNSSLEDFQSNDGSPESQLIKVDEKEYIIRQVMDLPFSESQAILLRYYKNLPIDKIAEMMDCSRSSVKRYIKSGQERLKSLLKL